jgi:hypothetical protein
VISSKKDNRVLENTPFLWYALVENLHRMDSRVIECEFGFMVSDLCAKVIILEAINVCFCFVQVTQTVPESFDGK